MLDWEFDELVEDIQEDMENLNKKRNPEDLIVMSLDHYENAFEEGEIKKITIILSMFMVPFKNLIIRTFDYKVLNETIKNYSIMDKNYLTNHQKEKLEEMINFYNEKIYMMKLWNGVEDGKDIFYQVVLDEEGNKKLVEMKEENNKEEVTVTNEQKYPELNDFISNCKKTKDFDNNKFLKLIEDIGKLTLNTNKEKLDLVFEINNIMWDFPYYDIRDEERKMNLDGRYERKKILEGLVKKLNIELSELVHYKDIEEIKEKVKRYNLNEDVSDEDFLTLYSLINSFYNEMLETICTVSFYIWNDYKTKLSKGREEGAEEEYKKRLAGSKEEKKKVIENFNNILGSIGLKR